jgi:hypothetical protein
MSEHSAAPELTSDLDFWEIALRTGGDSRELVAVSGLIVTESRFAEIALEFAHGTLQLRCRGGGTATSASQGA